MAKIGVINTLQVVKLVEFGVYLDGDELGEILLPIRQVPVKCQIGNLLEVFLYHDTENRLIATTHRPHAVLNEVGYLRVETVNEIGAFLDWGIPKALFVPFNQQSRRMKEGFSYLVYVYMDEVSKRITGSTKLKKFINAKSSELTVGQKVDLIIAEQTDAGYKAIINHSTWGFIYHCHVFQTLSEGQQFPGYVHNIREDGKIDLVLQKPGYEKIPDVADQILALLTSRDGFLPLTDDSSPDEIKNLLCISKKTFKKAIGGLFKARKIAIGTDGISLVPNSGKDHD